MAAGSAAPRLQTEHLARWQGAVVELALKDRAGPGAAVFYVRRRIQLAGAGPVVLPIIAVHLAQRQGAGVEFAVVNAHAHDFQLVAQSAYIRPAAIFFPAKDRCFRPGSDYHLALVDGHGIDLGYIFQIGDAGPAGPVVAAFEADDAVAVLEDVEVVAKNPDGHCAHTVAAAVDPVVLAIVAKEALGVERQAVELALEYIEGVDGIVAVFGEAAARATYFAAVLPVVARMAE